MAEFEKASDRLNFIKRDKREIMAVSVTQTVSAWRDASKPWLAEVTGSFDALDTFAMID
jgi:hypothetical protein